MIGVLVFSFLVGLGISLVFQGERDHVLSALFVLITIAGYAGVWPVTQHLSEWTQLFYIVLLVAAAIVAFELSPLTRGDRYTR